MSAVRASLLKAAIPLVRELGFTRQALANSVLCLTTEPRLEPLPDSSITTLFGDGDDARRTLIRAWLEEGKDQMNKQAIQNADAIVGTSFSSVDNLKEMLRFRLKYNEPVLSALPEAFALLASPKNGLPPLDPRPALQHATSIANVACTAVRDASIGPSWYTRRGTLAVIYTAAELHQLASPTTVHAFLDTLFDTAGTVRTAIDETELFSRYVIKSWAALIKSADVF